MLIKRYPNRKLYNTETKQYITLDELADYIRQGEDLYVFDHASGADLTDLTLTQILFEQVKRRAGFLPRTVLPGLIQASSSRISALSRHFLGTSDLNQQVNSEIDRRIRKMVLSGDISEMEGESLQEKLISLRAEEHPAETIHETLVGSLIEKILAQYGLATRAELQQLMKQIEVLSSKLDEMVSNENNAG